MTSNCLFNCRQLSQTSQLWYCNVTVKPMILWVTELVKRHQNWSVNLMIVCSSSHIKAWVTGIIMRYHTL